MKRPSCSFAFCFLLLCALLPHTARAYSVLSHEEVVDMAWKVQIVSLLKARFPGISDDDIRTAHAYAYGGSVIQDIGYYPFGSHYFSDLLHYVRPGDFVNALIRNSTTPNEYAFALGALAHFCGDTVGHPYVNQVTADENPALFQRYGRAVTYAEDPTAHLRTEFGFDVVEVAHGHYSQENYRDFIGFQVSKALLERAFFETYGIKMGDIITHEDLAISTYRHAVSSLIPQMTRVAYVNYKDQIHQADPGVTKDKFLYRLKQTEYDKSFGTDYTRVGFRGRALAFVLRTMPKVGPLRALKLHIPDATEQELYLKSVNSVVDQYKVYLMQVHAAPAPLPPPDPKDADDARKAANKLAKDLDKYKKLAQQAKDPADRAKKQKVAVSVEQTASKAFAAAQRTQAKVGHASGATPADPSAASAGAVVKSPSTPLLPELDMDTGQSSSAGEYSLADQTYARLLSDLVRAPSPQEDRKSSALIPTLGSGRGSSMPPKTTALHSSLTHASSAIPPTRKLAPTATPGSSFNVAVAADIERFFAHPVARTGPLPTHHQSEKEAALANRVHTDLAALRALESGSDSVPQTHL